MTTTNSPIFVLNLRKRNISKEDLIFDLQKVADEIGQNSITRTTYEARGSYGVNTILRRFGSWNDGLKEAGLMIQNRVIRELSECVAAIWSSALIWRYRKIQWDI